MPPEVNYMTGYSFHIPRWNQLPSIDLYIDQIIALVDENLSAVLCHHDGFPLTKSMINNYVKAKLVAAPINKKYPRISVAMVIVICLLKNCYSTDEIGKLVAYTKANGGIEYAERRMWEFHDEACHFIDTYIHQDDIRQALRAYLDYVIKRNK